MNWFIIPVVVIVGTVLVIWPFYLERSKPVIGPNERHGADGAFAQLSQGVTHYRWVGPTRGPVAIVVPGLMLPMVSMEAVAKGLGNLGYRVLMYDLYGRGLSDAPTGQQNRAFFLRQLSDLITYHQLEEDITLAGYSMGAGIVTAYASENTHQIKQIILIAPSCIKTRESRFSRFCTKVPLLGNWVHGMFAAARIKRTIPAQAQTKEIEDVSRAQRRELRRRGYLPAILSSRRGMLCEVQEAEHRQLGRQGIRAIVIWAGADPIVPLRAIGLMAEWNRKARHEVVENAGHSLPFTHGEALVKAMRNTMFD